MQKQSYFMILKNEPKESVPTGGTHWLEYLPGFVYCFVPSTESNSGKVYAYNYRPEFLKKFFYCQEIRNVRSPVVNKN